MNIDHRYLDSFICSPEKGSSCSQKLFILSVSKKKKALYDQRAQHLFEAILEVTLSMSGPLDRSSNTFFSHKSSDRSIVYASLKHGIHGMYGCIRHTNKGMNGNNYWIKTGNTYRTSFSCFLSFLCRKDIHPGFF